MNRRQIFHQVGLAVLLGLAHLFSSACSRAQQSDLDQKLYGASQIPDRVALTWTGDPTTSMTVSWRTTPTVTASIGEIALADDGPVFIAKTTKTTGASELVDADLGEARYHTVEFKDLTPDTLYVYRVGDGVKWTEWSHFRTAHDKPEPFTFVYFGDAQNDIRSHWSRVVRTALLNAPSASFMLHAGDLINKANADREWGEWFEASSFIHRTMPAIATPGNHEYASGGLSKLWRPTFAFPANGPESLPDTCYYIDYQGVRLISLNSNEQQKEQIPWLDSVLENNPQRWTIVTYHHPLYSSKKGRDNLALREAWQPIFDKHRVDLALQGHDHTYARTGFMQHEANVNSGAEAREKESGTVYVVSVSGPKMYDLGRRPFMHRAAEDTQLFQVITVNGDELYYQARTATGRLYDAFTLKKRDGEPNEMIDKIPNIPERLRSRNPAAASQPN